MDIALWPNSAIITLDIAFIAKIKIIKFMVRF